MQSKYIESAISILEPAFDNDILSFDQFSQLIDFDKEAPFSFITQLVTLYRNETILVLDIRNEIYDSGKNYDRLKETIIDVELIRNLLHKMRGSAVNIGNIKVDESCIKFKEVIHSKNEQLIKNGPRHFKDLEKDCHMTFDYFDRFLEFVQQH